mmetsp:Transcript_26037/g.61729  ORF Transcript_26037/g.61729 Transcript_26037/m.61729 type:complete len:103 (+) Transcript_26037:248-556(+)
MEEDVLSTRQRGPPAATHSVGSNGTASLPQDQIPVFRDGEVGVEGSCAGLLNADVKKERIQMMKAHVELMHATTEDSHCDAHPDVFFLRYATSFCSRSQASW